jgi:transcriptional regulator with XRE-family HTH domain
MDTCIGEQIKQIRKEKGFTLKDLSAATGLSVSYLSMLERGLSSPTIANMQKVCQALNITLTDLLLNLDGNKVLVKKEDRRIIFEDHKDVLYEAITEGNRHIKSICMTVYDNLEHDSGQHIADEFGYCVKGSIMITVDGIKYHLHEGDALYIAAHSHHSFKKTSEEECVTIWSYHNISMEASVNYPTNPNEMRKSKA